MSLAAAEVTPLLRAGFGRPYRYESELPSTQDVLKGADLDEGAVVATDHQTAGRGRSGRAWEDAPGTALLFSIVLRPPPASPAPQLSLVCALAVAEAVEASTDLSTQIKWPNDVMLDRRKVAGILLEVAGGAVVCGVGVNVNQTREQLPAGTTAEACSLRTVMGLAYDRGTLLVDVLERLEGHYRAWLDGGLEAIFDGVGSRNFLFGRRLRAGEVEGTGGRIERDGRLEVVTGHGRSQLIESGEITLAS
jgi:BirA family transcriptional regulator, biotin operon repressor / biotin---[acetyl-CoA-carboxylase] ligase